MVPGIKRCVIKGCKTTQTNLHRLPDDERKEPWLTFIYPASTRPDPLPKYIAVCGIHFTRECFTNIGQVESGFAKSLILRRDAIPTLFGGNDGDDTGASSAPFCPKRDVSCQTDLRMSHIPTPEETRTIGTQCGLSTFHAKFRSKGTQADIRPASTVMEDPADRDYDPEESLTVLTEPSILSESATLPPHKTRKFIVYEDCLMELFRTCPVCSRQTEPKTWKVGTFWKVKQNCEHCEHERQWQTQPLTGSTPAGNLQLSAAICISGASFVTIEKEVPSEEGCSGITFDVSEITFASDKESNCSDKGHDEEEEEETEEEKSGSDSEWEQSESDISEEEDLDSNSEFEADDLDSNSDSELPVKIRQLCPDCGAFFYTSKSHTCEYKIKPYSCNVCGKRCVDEKSLQCHSRIHNEDYEHFCKFCLATFKTRLDKLAHEDAHAYNGRPYQCPDCSLTFSKINERNSHLKKHRGPKIFSCPHCDLEFTKLGVLERHVVVHTGVKPFVCEVCSRSFNQAGHLKSHMRLHTGEKPFQCQHCDKSFNHNVSLKSHVMRYHSGASDSESNRHIENVERSVAGEDQMREKVDENMSDDHTDQAREVSPLEKGPTKKVKTKKRVRMSTGRPKGRPKRNAAVGDMSLVPAVSGEAQDPSTAAETLKAGRLKRTRPKDIESSGSDGDSTLELSGEDEQEGTKEVRKSKVRASKRPKNFDCEDYDSDSDFDPSEEM